MGVRIFSRSKSVDSIIAPLEKIRSDLSDHHASKCSARDHHEELSLAAADEAKRAKTLCENLTALIGGNA